MGRWHRHRDDGFWLRSTLRKALALEHADADDGFSSASSGLLGSQILTSLPEL